MDIKQKFIITFAHQKGGAGKSTMCIYITVALLSLYNHLRIGVIDLDSEQGTTYNFFSQRRKNTTWPMVNYYFALKHSAAASKTQSNEEEQKLLLNTIDRMEYVDIIIIDTAGTINNYSKLAIEYSNLLITPLNQSLLDTSALLYKNQYNQQSEIGAFGQLIFDIVNKKNLAIQKNTSNQKNYWKWLFIMNRISPLKHNNTELINQIFQEIINIYKGRALGYVYDRGFFKNCNDGTSAYDLFHKSIKNRPSFYNMNHGSLSAYMNINKMAKQIIEFYNDFQKC